MFRKTAEEQLTVPHPDARRVENALVDVLRAGREKGRRIEHAGDIDTSRDRKSAYSTGSVHGALAGVTVTLAMVVCVQLSREVTIERLVLFIGLVVVGMLPLLEIRRLTRQHEMLHGGAMRVERVRVSTGGRSRRRPHEDDGVIEG